MRNDLIKIGQITSPHGLRGHVRVYPLTDFLDRFSTLRNALIGPDARPVGLVCRSTAHNLLILEIEGITTREQAEQLRQQYIQVPKSEAYPLPEGHYYVFDLVGLRVVDLEGNLLGQLKDVDRSSPAHDLYVVQTASDRTYMVPAVRQFIKEINLPQGYIAIQPIPGLLED